MGRGGGGGGWGWPSGAGEGAGEVGVAVPVAFGGSRRPPVLPPSRPSSSPPDVADLLGLLPPLCSEEPPVPGAVDRPEPVEVSEDAVPERCRCPGPPLREGASGRRDCSGATSSSMASKTDDTWLLTSPSCTGSRSRSAPQASRCEREKLERAWMGPREFGSRSYASCSRRWPSAASCCMPDRARRISLRDSWSR